MAVADTGLSLAGGINVTIVTPSATATLNAALDGGRGPADRVVTPAATSQHAATPRASTRQSAADDVTAVTCCCGH